jgi:hypothetical protein
VTKLILYYLPTKQNPENVNTKITSNSLLSWIPEGSTCKTGLLDTPKRRFSFPYAAYHCLVGGTGPLAGTHSMMQNII